MTARSRIQARAAELASQGLPFVRATVVRAQCPTSARPGDGAVVLGDGAIEGFVGGQCVEGSVRVAALSVLASGESLLLRVLPEGGEGDEADASAAQGQGAQTVVNPCLSGGAIEIFLEPQLPSARVAILGSTPIAESLEIQARHLGFAVGRYRPGEFEVNGAAAVIVASHGREEEAALRAALDADVGFIGLVASRVRGAAVLDELGLSCAQRARINSPVGLDIGAKTAEEIALSILVEIVQSVRRGGLQAGVVEPPSIGAAAGAPASAVDPVCGMTVMVDEATPHLEIEDESFWFCNTGCRVRYAEERNLSL